MHLIRLISISLLLIPFLFSCNNDYVGNENEIVIKSTDSPYHIEQDLIIDSAMRLVLLPGTELVFHNNSKIVVHGSIYVRGENEKPVTLKPFSADSSWGGINILQPSDSCFFNGAIIKNGLIYGEDVNIIMKDCRIENNHQLDQFDALIRLFRGSVQVTDSYFKSNDTGEGLLFHDIRGKPTLVENCDFKGVSDAIEYLDVEDGIIEGCRFSDIKQKLGDGIDLNGCSSIRIENNYFENIRDFGIEVGNDKYGPSYNVLIAKNIFTRCSRGVVVKGGSNATILNNTFYNNEFGVGCMVEHYGANYDPNQIEIVNSIFSNSSKNDFQNNENSSINFRYCLSDKQLLEGEGNIFASPLFINADRGNFRLSEQSPCIRSADPNTNVAFESSIEDIGAIAFEDN